jgi:CRISPR-associated endonuclease/helicase Cas3
MAQALALCIVSHHSGLIDCLERNGTQQTVDRFSKRIKKSEEKAHLREVQAKMDQVIHDRAEALFADPLLLKSLAQAFKAITKANKHSKTTACFQQGLLVRFLFSCLVDSDRINSADFEKPWAAQQRLHSNYTPFSILSQRLEKELATFSHDSPVNSVRRKISDACLLRANDNKGIFTLSVPTGGGKTLASLRFALQHAQHHRLTRIFYIIPFTSIIEQNAAETRRILEPHGSNDRGKIVLEHHSNLLPEHQSWKSKLLTENWDAPVIYTTMVQFLETWFGAGTRGVRRLHQFANTVLIFDEIQALPINCVHLFNNAMQFLVEQCGSSVVLCTATQPLLHQVDAIKGCLQLPPHHELMRGEALSVAQLFAELQRVEVFNCQQPGGYACEEVAAMALEELQLMGSCLVIVNTKNTAQRLYSLCQQQLATSVFSFHLSTNMCPAHRKKVLRIMRRLLKKSKKVLCISTQLIEAGVDISLGAVIRVNAGLDAIAQAAGRCNRHGEFKYPNGTPRKGRVSIVNLAAYEEKLGMLPDIAIAQEKTNRVLRENAQYQEDILSPTIMERYFKYYFFDRRDEMDYPVKRKGNLLVALKGKEKVKNREDSLLDLLSHNSKAAGDYERSRDKDAPPIYFKQAFMEAAQAFKAIDAPTRGVLIPYGKRGREIVAALCGSFEPTAEYALLREAQQYTVNVFPQLLSKLIECKVLHPVQKDVDILYLKDFEYYSKDFGLSDSVVGEANFLSII